MESFYLLCQDSDRQSHPFISQGITEAMSVEAATLCQTDGCAEKTPPLIDIRLH